MDPELVGLREELSEGSCKYCGDMGMRVIEEDGKRFAVRCECSFAKSAMRAFEKAGIPKRHEECKFENFDSVPGNPQLGLAALKLREFVKNWETSYGQGLLITGNAGIGKTHLAVATLRSLMAQYNAVGLFCDHRTLLKAVQNSYNQRSADSERQVLTPVFNAEVLVLDELGGEKRSDWTSETIEHILNTRYNDRKTTIITTNLPNLPPAATETVKPRGKTQEQVEIERVARRETLGDRVGERIFSRLQEMCIVIDLQGADFRKSTKRASFF